MFKRIAVLILGMGILGPLAAAEPAVARVSALASGKLLLNGKPADIRGIDTELAKLRNRNGEVWYYRENPQAEPHPNAIAVIELVAKHRLPISMSTKPDFSDYVDRDGRSRPR
ncbi:MAG: hypothetical protein ACREVR_15135 [Burkholderiales bacterium]